MEPCFLSHIRLHFGYLATLNNIKHLNYAKWTISSS